MIPSPSYENTVEVSVKGTLNALRAASANSAVKRFVLTSSTVAAGVAQQGAPAETFDETSWFKESISYAKSLPEDNPMKPGMNYLASKTASEVAAWDFVQTEKVSFETQFSLVPYLVRRADLSPRISSLPSLSTLSFHLSLSARFSILRLNLARPERLVRLLYNVRFCPCDKGKLIFEKRRTVKDLFTGESDVWAKSLPLREFLSHNESLAFKLTSSVPPCREPRPRSRHRSPSRWSSHSSMRFQHSSLRNGSLCKLERRPLNLPQIVPW